MKTIYWWPDRRPTYRIVAVRHWLYEYALQQRYRWLWFEWWKTIDQSSSYCIGNLKDRKRFLESLDVTPEPERVVDVT